VEAEFTTEPMVATGRGHTLALRRDGTVWAWGSNFDGQLGDGTTTNSYTPVQVQNLSRITAVAVRGLESTALRDDGTVWTWGEGFWDGYSQVNHLIPVQVPNLSNITAIAVSLGYRSIALRDDGTVWAWHADAGVWQLGESLSGVIAIAEGWQHIVALRDDGTVWTWGLNNSGQLGDGARVCRDTPVQAQNLYNITAIAAGWRHSAALREDGTVWTWGRNAYGQLGDGTIINRHTPIQVPNLSNITAIAAGENHTIASQNKGAIWAWGLNYGMLGDGTTTDRHMPTQVQNLSNIISISANGWHTVALKDNGTVWAWGSNLNGQLGDGTGPYWSDEVGDWIVYDRLSPVQVLGPNGVGHFSLTEDTPFAFIFNDIPRTHWAREAVTFVYERGLMQGTTASTFAPNASLTRGMVVTILHRMAGEPTVASRPAFSDVPTGAWFSDAIAWAAYHEIVTGVSFDTFAPNANITREQFATMLYRYAEMMDFSTEVLDNFDLTASPDYDQISTWAEAAMTWAVYNSLITGADAQGTLNPNGTATRAQCAAILQRFVLEFK